MKTLIRTIIALIVLSPAALSPAMVQSGPGGKIQTFTISGNAGVAGVLMRGLPGDPVTDQNGRYSVKVERDWRGSVTPEKEGYVFEPSSMIYENLDGDRFNDNYTANAFTFTISGQTGLAGVLMSGLPDEPIADNEGIYRVSVPYGWAGMVTPMKEGYIFMPSSRHYPKVTADLVNQDYAPSAVETGVVSQYEDMYGSFGSSSRRRGRSTGIRTAIGPIGSRKVLVVPADEIKAQDVAVITEDMQVMSHILDERFKETRRIQGVFTDFGDFFGRDNRQTEAIYLQGYGVLFSMEVNFSFSPPPKPQQQQAEQSDESVDSTWQRARQQVFSPGQFEAAEGSGSTEEYDSQMVEELKRDLITTLKHAANIRSVQPDEWIILTIIGGGRQAGGFGGGGFMMGGMGMSGGSAYGGTSSGGMGEFGARYGVSSGYGAGMAGGGMGGGMMGGMGGGMGGIGGMGGFAETGVSSATVLTIRAKKADIDDFAKDEQDYEQFRQKVQIFTY
jgi:hypothetical protein